MLERKEENPTPKWHVNRAHDIEDKRKIFTHPDGEMVTISYDGLIEKFSLDNPTVTKIFPSRFEIEPTLIKLCILHNGNIIFSHPAYDAIMMNSQLEELAIFDLPLTNIMQFSSGVVIGSTLEGTPLGGYHQQFYFIDPDSFKRIQKLDLTAQPHFFWSTWLESKLLFYAGELVCYDLTTREQHVIAAQQHCELPFKRIVTIPELEIAICGDDHRGIIVGKEKHLLFDDKTGWDALLMPDKQSILLSGDRGLHQFDPKTFTLSTFPLDVEGDYPNAVLTKENQLVLMNWKRIVLASTTPNPAVKPDPAIQCVLVNTSRKLKWENTRLGSLLMHDPLVPLPDDLVAGISTEKDYSPYFVKIIDAKTMQVKCQIHGEQLMARRGAHLVIVESVGWDDARLQQWDAKTNTFTTIATVPFPFDVRYIHFISENALITIGQDSLELVDFSAIPATKTVLSNNGSVYERHFSCNELYFAYSAAYTDEAEPLVYNIKQKAVIPVQGKITEPFCVSGKSIVMAKGAEISVWDIELTHCRERITMSADVIRICHLGSRLFCAVLKNQQVVFIDSFFPQFPLAVREVNFAIHRFEFDAFANRLYGRSETHLFVFDLNKIPVVRNLLDRKKDAEHLRKFSLHSISQQTANKDEKTAAVDCLSDRRYPN